MGCFHLKLPSRSNTVLPHQGLKDSSPRTTPLSPWPRTPFKSPGASSPLPALPQQCWSPAPHSHVLSQSQFLPNHSCVTFQPRFVCLWGDTKYRVLVLCAPSAAPLLPEAVGWIPQLQAPWSEGSVGFLSASHTHHFWGSSCFERSDKIHNQCTYGKMSHLSPSYRHILCFRIARAHTEIIQKPISFFPHQ